MTTDKAQYEPDILVVALGADLDPAATPGMVEEGTEYYSRAAQNGSVPCCPGSRGATSSSACSGNFFKCPAAPFETALMLHDYLEQRGRRSVSSIKVISPMSTPDSDLSRGLGRHPRPRSTHAASAGGPSRRSSPWTRRRRSPRWRTGEAPYDLFLGIPVHRAPQVVEESALAEDGWVAVDHTTFATRFENVYAVGDVTSAPVPRVGAIAEGEARTLADVLDPSDPRRRPTGALPGLATCYIEFGGSKVARFDANFLSGPKPFGSFTEASEAMVANKVEFGASRRRRWFGMEG